MLSTRGKAGLAVVGVVLAAVVVALVTRFASPAPVGSASAAAETLGRLNEDSYDRALTVEIVAGSGNGNVAERLTDVDAHLVCRVAASLVPEAALDRPPAVDGGNTWPDDVMFRATAPDGTVTELGAHAGEYLYLDGTWYACPAGTDALETVYDYLAVTYFADVANPPAFLAD